MNSSVPVPLPPQRSLPQAVADALRLALKGGTWRERLPGERDLSRQLNVSRPTLRAALALLEKEGWISTVRGKVRRIARKPLSTGAAAAPIVRLLIPFPLQEAPQFLFYWIDKLRELLPPAGIALEIQSGGRFYTRRPEKELAHLTRQFPGSIWLLARTTEPMQRWFANQKLPCVVAGSCFPGVRLPSVDVAHRAAARHAATQLLTGGHRKIALIIQTPKMAGDIETEQGFHEAFAGGANGASAIVAHHDGTLGDIRRQLDRLLRQSPPPTGFFALRAHSALAVASELTRRGFRFPADAAIISRDSDHFLDFFSPELARYTADPDLFSRRLAAMVIRLAHEGVTLDRPVRLMPKFVKGETLR